MSEKPANSGKPGSPSRTVSQYPRSTNIPACIGPHASTVVYEKYTYELGTPGPHNVRALSYRERSMVVSNYDRASLENKRSLTRSSERLFSSSELGRDRHKQHRVNLSACKSRKIVISSPHSQMGSYLVSRLAAGYQYAKYGAYAS